MDECNHIIEIHNDSGDQQSVYAVCLDSREIIVDGGMVFSFCPLCGENVRDQVIVARNVALGDETSSRGDE